MALCCRKLFVGALSWDTTQGNNHMLLLILLFICCEGLLVCDFIGSLQYSIFIIKLSALVMQFS